MVSGSDLSEYEMIRLENINRNAEFLRSIGLSIQADNGVKGFIPEQKIKAKEPVRRQKIEREEKVPSSPTRKSRRLRNQIEESSLPDDYVDAGDDDGEDYKLIKKEKKAIDQRFSSATISEPVDVDYDTIPQTSEQLDDFEFKNYAILRKWRAGRCKELETEPYKICQNRTLCEVIRRRRNDDNWGRDEDDDSQKIPNDLIQCWGIGPSKTQPGGFGFEILTEMESIEISENFKNSQKLFSTARIEETNPIISTESSMTPTDTDSKVEEIP